MEPAAAWWECAPSFAAPSVHKHNQGKTKDVQSKQGKGKDKRGPQGGSGGIAAQSVVLPSDPRVIAARARAQAALDASTAQFEKERRDKPSSDDKWLRTVLSSGTLSDKVAAMALFVQSSPLHTLRTLDQLLGIAKKKSRRESQLAGDTLSDLFVNGLLPDRELVWFHERAGVTAAGVPVDVLKYWLFEDTIKQKFREFVAALEASCSDGLVHFKLASVKRAVTLASGRPEQRRTLINLVVSKLGDVEKKVASTAGFLLSKLIESHAALATLVVGSVQQMVVKDKVTPKAQYYGVVFLNQLELVKGDATVPNQLMKIYFTLFEACLASGDVKGKLLSALLAGVNRAFPFASLDAEFLNPRIDSLFRLVHTSTFNTAVQALMLLFKVTSKDGTLADRFYRTLYSSLLSPELPESSKQSLFLSLVFKALKADPDPVRAQAVVKRLAQVASFCAANFAAAALYIISEVLCKRADVCVMVLKRAKQAAPPKPPAPQPTRPGSSVGHVSSDSTHREHAPPSCYDTTKRDPKYAGAEFTCFWELAPLAAHYHPSVRKFAEQMMLNPSAPLGYDGDPLHDFSMMSFLDRFSFRNPKKKVLAAAQAAKTARSKAGNAAAGGSGDGLNVGPGSARQTDEDYEAEVAAAYRMMSEEGDVALTNAKQGRLRGSSKMQPTVLKRGRVATDAPANSAAFRNLAPSEVRDEDMFIYQYVQSRPEKPAAGAVRDMTEEEEDEFADALAEKMMRDHARSTGGGVDDDLPDEDFDYLSDDLEGDSGSKSGDGDGEGDGDGFDVPADSSDDDDEEDDGDDVGGDDDAEAALFMAGEDFDGMSDMDGSEEEAIVPAKKRKGATPTVPKTKKRKPASVSVFADAETSDEDDE